MSADKLNVFDVRKQGEWDGEHLEHAKHASLQFLNDHLADFSTYLIIAPLFSARSM